MRSRAELKPVVRGSVVGLGLGKYVFAGGGVALMLAASVAAWAGPEGAKVERGNVKIIQRGNRTIIRASDRSIINYRSFDVGRSESVRFIQPGRDASVLNRINSQRPTQIDGSIRANGQVYFVNPNGVYFSGTAMIDAAGIYAAAGNISSQDFAAGRNHFTDIQGDVVNAGRIEAGTTALIGRHVSNSGIIVSDQADGVVAMVSGEDVTLTPRGSGIGVRVDGRSQPGDSTAAVSNTGQITARDGQALMVAGDVYALAIKNTGSVKARDIAIEAKRGGVVEVGGVLDASDRSIGGRGGDITITGRRIDVAGATIDASGSRGGGDVRIGGDFRGEGDLRRAQTVNIDGSTVINTDAVRTGDGGTVAVWSDQRTTVAGAITARGGELGGHGGMVETSGKVLDFGGVRVDASGSKAAGDWQGGQWLLDPTNLIIDGSNVGAIIASLDAGTDVTVETISGGSDAGNLVVDATINKTMGTDATLTLRAANDVFVNQAITSSSGELNVAIEANADIDDNNRSSGNIEFANDGMTTFGAIITNGGDVSMQGVDLNLGAGTISAVMGDVTISPNSATDVTIGLGGGTGRMTVSDAELNNIAASTLTIGSGSAGDITVGAISPTNVTNLTLRTAGTVKESAADDTTDITVAGRLTITAADGIGDPGTNDGTGTGPLDIDVAELDAAVSGAGGLFIKDSGGLTVVNAATADGKVSIRSTGDVTLQNVAANEAMPSGRTLEVVSAGAAGIDSTAATISTNGLGHFQTTASNADIRLDGMQVTGDGSVALNTTGATGNATVISSGAVPLAASTVGGALAVTAGDAITQTGTLDVGGDLTVKTLNNSGAAITLTDVANTFHGITAQARNAADSADAVGDIAITERGVIGNTTMTVTQISTTGNVTLIAPDIAIDTGGMGSAISAGAGVITLRPDSAGTSIGIDAPATFQISLAELQELSTTGEVSVGRTDGGAITVGSSQDINLVTQGYNFRLRGGVTSFARAVQLADNRQLALQTGAITSTGLTADVVIGGANGRLVIDSTGGIDLESSVAKFAARSGSGNVDISNFGDLQIASIGGIEGIRGVAGSTINVAAGGSVDVAAAIVTSGAGSASITATGGIQDSTSTGVAVAAPTVNMSSDTGAISGSGGMGAFKVDATSLTALAQTGVNVRNTGVATLAATLNTDTGAAVLESAGSIQSNGAAWAGDSVEIVTTGSGAQGVITLAEDVTADAGDIRLAGHELSITGADTMISAGTGDIRIERTTAGSIGVGDVAAQDMNVNNLEMSRMTAANLIIGDATNTTSIVVINAQSPTDATMPVSTIDKVILRAEADNAQVEFTGSNSRFKDLEVRADAGIDVDSNITVSVGDLVLNADADGMEDADAPGEKQDKLFIHTGRTIATASGAGDVVLSGSATGTGIEAEGSLTLNSGSDVNINSAITAGGALTLDADGAVTFAGAGEGETLDIRANNGITFAENVTNQSGNLTINADSDADGTGTFTLATGKTLDTGDGDLTLTAADVTLDGSIDAGMGDVFITRSTAGEIAIGDFTDMAGRMTIGGSELERVAAANMTVGGGAATAITVDGVTSDQSDGITGTLTLDAGTTLAFSGAASTFHALNARADETITVSANLTTTGDVAMSADSDGNATGDLVISGNINTGGNDFAGSGDDLDLTGAINAGFGDVSIARSSTGNIVVNNVVDADGRMVINDAELARITSEDLNIGGGATQAITVRDFSTTDGAGIAGTVTFDAGTTLTMNGQSTFKSLNGLADDRVAVNGNITTTVGDLVLNGNADAATDTEDKIELGGGLVLDSARDIILSAERGGIDAAGGLTLRADRTVTVNHSLATSGDTTVRADDNGDGTGDFTLASAAAFSTSGSNLSITSADVVVNGNINTAGGSVAIERSSPGDIAIGSFDTQAGRMTIAGAELGRIVATGLAIGGANTESMTVTGVTDSNSNSIAGVTTLRALASDGSITFSGTGSRFNALTAEAGSTITTSTTLQTDSGAIVLDAGANTDTANDGMIALGGNLQATASTASFFDITLDSPVRLRSNITVTAEDINFNSRVNSSSSTLRTLTLNSNQNGTTTLRGNVGGDNELAQLITNADGVTRLGGDIFTTRQGVSFRDRVTLIDDVVIRDRGAGIEFFGAINSDSSATPRSLTLLARNNTSGTVNVVPLVTFSEDVGATAPLKNLNINFSEALGRDGRTNVPRVATIVVRPRSVSGNNVGQFIPVTGTLQTFRFIVTEGFRMGQNEKMTVGGNVEIRAGSLARLGDITSLGNMTVTSPNIRLLRRAAGELSARNPLNTSTNGVRIDDVDTGLDFVAGGRFNFSTVPVAVGSGLEPTFGTATGQRDQGNRLSGFIFQRFRNFRNNLIDLDSPIVTQDLKSSGPSDTNFASSLAGAIPRESRTNDVGENTPVSQAQFKDLVQLGVFPRDLNDEERIASLIGWATYDDYPRTDAPTEADFTTVVNRLPSERAKEVIAAFQSTFFTTSTDPTTGATQSESRAPIIRKAFEAAVANYAEARPGATERIDPYALREFIERSETDTEALGYARELQNLLKKLELLGLTRREFTSARNVLLRQIRPKGIRTLDQFNQFIMGPPQQVN